MDENKITSSAPVSSPAPAQAGADGGTPKIIEEKEEIFDIEGAVATAVEKAIAPLEEKIQILSEEIEVLKKAGISSEKAESKPVKTRKCKPLFFDHNIHTDSGPVIGRYEPKSDAEYERLKPFALEEASE